MINPKAAQDRHQEYLEAFSIRPYDTLTDIMYLNYINKYIMDPNINYLNNDDQNFFNDLLFNSNFGSVHFRYCEWITSKWAHFAFASAIVYLSNYSHFLGKANPLLLESFLKQLFELKNKQFAIDIFDNLSIDNKIRFIKLADRYPEIINHSSKFKTFSVFL